MAYCGPRGIELDAFLRWSPRSQQAALDWMSYENQRCPQCSTHPQDWAENDFAFHSHLAECKGCKAQQRMGATDEAKQGHGVYAVIAAGHPLQCPQCRPSDDD